MLETLEREQRNDTTTDSEQTDATGNGITPEMYELLFGGADETADNGETATAHDDVMSYQVNADELDVNEQVEGMQTLSDMYGTEFNETVTGTKLEQDWQKHFGLKGENLQAAKAKLADIANNMSIEELEEYGIENPQGMSKEEILYQLYVKIGHEYAQIQATDYNGQDVTVDSGGTSELNIGAEVPDTNTVSTAYNVDDNSTGDNFPQVQGDNQPIPAVYNPDDDGGNDDNVNIPENPWAHVNHQVEESDNNSNDSQVKQAYINYIRTTYSLYRNGVDQGKFGASITASNFLGINMNNLDNYSVQDLDKIQNFMNQYFTDTVNRTIMLEVNGHKILTEPYQATNGAFIRQTILAPNQAEKDRVNGRLDAQYRNLTQYLSSNGLSNTPANRQRYANARTWAIVESSTVNACSNCSLASAQLSDPQLRRTLMNKIVKLLNEKAKMLTWVSEPLRSKIVRQMDRLNRCLIKDNRMNVIGLNVDEVSKQMRTLAVSGNSQTEPINGPAKLRQFNSIINGLRTGNNREIERIARENPDMLNRLGAVTREGILSWKEQAHRRLIIEHLKNNGNITFRTNTGTRNLTVGNAEGHYFAGNPRANTYYFDSGYIDNAQAGAYQWFSNHLNNSELTSFGIRNNCVTVQGCYGGSNLTKLTQRLTNLNSNENLSDFVIFIKTPTINGHYVRPVEIRDGNVYVQDSNTGTVHRLSVTSYELKKLTNT